MDWSSFNKLKKEVLTEDIPPAEAMARMPEWANTQEDLKAAAIWGKFPQIDWSEDAKLVQDWFTNAMQELAETPDVDLAGIRLGDSPEIFEVDGYRFSGGQGKIDELITMLLDRENEPWVDEVDWDNVEELACENTADLPSGIWQYYEEVTESDDSADDVDAGAESVYAIWYMLAAVSVTNLLRHGNLTFADIVGDRAKVCLMIGYEDAQSYFGSLTSEGWQEPQA